MLFSNFLLAVVALEAGVASAYQCRHTDFGRYNPLTTQREAFRYCTSLLQGKVARTVRKRTATMILTTTAETTTVSALGESHVLYKSSRADEHVTIRRPQPLYVSVIF